MRAAEVIVRCMEREGVEVVFGYPGGAVLPLYEALRTASFQHILIRQEQAAVHSASGYARATNKVGVAVGTSGPGATNLVTGIATAYMDSIPIVIFTGQVKTSAMGRDAFQEVDITGATEPFTKHSYLVKDASQLPRIIREAFHIAHTGRPGPVLIDLPVDVQQASIDLEYPETVTIRGYHPTVRGHVGQIKRALRRIRTSRRPLICVGGGVVRSDACDIFRDFVSQTHIPVIHTLMGIGALPTRHPYYIGMIGSHGYPYANKAIGHSDLLIVVGARIADRATAGVGVFAKNADVIHIDVDPAEIGKNLGALIPVVGDAKNILESLAAGAEPLDTAPWLTEIHEWKASYTPRRSEGLAGIDPVQAFQSLGKYVSADAILTADVGQNQIWAARNFPMGSKHRFFTSGGLGTMGYGLPAAVGAKIGAPQTQVVAVVGDGGFQMSLHELGTIRQNQLDITILLFNNQRLGMVRELQENSFGQPFGIELAESPDFQLIAKAYGIHARRTESQAEFEEALGECLSRRGPNLIECIVDPKTSTL